MKIIKTLLALIVASTFVFASMASAGECMDANKAKVEAADKAACDAAKGTWSE